MRNNLLVHHVNFDAAFLNAPLKENINMNQIKEIEKDNTNSIYKLNKTMYVLKQARVSSCKKIP